MQISSGWPNSIRYLNDQAQNESGELLYSKTTLSYTWGPINEPHLRWRRSADALSWRRLCHNWYWVAKTTRWIVFCACSGMHLEKLHLLWTRRKCGNFDIFETLKRQNSSEICLFTVGRKQMSCYLHGIITCPVLMFWALKGSFVWGVLRWAVVSEAFSSSFCKPRVVTSSVFICIKERCRHGVRTHVHICRYIRKYVCLHMYLLCIYLIYFCVNVKM